MFPFAAALALSWIAQNSGTTASFRGIDVVSAQVIWASGTNGAYIETTDGGKRWESASVPGAQTLDFRGVKAFDRRTAFLLSSGPGDQSRVYKTSDAGEHWRLLFTNPDAKGFFDAIAFWDRSHGIVLGDPVNGEFAVFTTDDGGEHWTRQKAPSALPNEGAFAASNTSLVMQSNGSAWFGTGGPNAARVFRTTDWGRKWSVFTTPLSSTSASSGVYSLAFRDESHGVAVGGDYQKPGQTSGTIALTDDGGRTWRKPKTELGGYRSAVLYLNSQFLLAVGPSGCDYSQNGGETWRTFSHTALNAVSGSDGSVWAAGAKGRLVTLSMRSVEH